MHDQLVLLPGLLTDHLQLSLLALVLGAVVSLPAGIAARRSPRAEQLVLGLASVIQTIPALALLAVMVPLLALAARALEGSGIEIRSIGFLPAIIALTLYSLLPILRNTVTGLAGVDPAVVEAARGVGMTARERLLRVELPLAAPVIVAGLRTSTVWVVGMATLSTPIGAPSLGNYIFGGLQTRNHAAVLVGCVAAAGLAVLLDQLIRAVETGLAERRPRRARAGAAAIAALALYAGGSAALERGGDGPRPLTVAAKPFTEQYVLSEIVARRITRETGLPATTVGSLGSQVAFDALVAGDLDLSIDYSGTLWANVLDRDDVPADRREVLREVRRFLRQRHGLTVLGELGFENAYALAMRRADAERLGVRSIADLVPHAAAMSIGGDYEFFGRPEWRAVRTRYGIAFREERAMDPSLMYQAAGEGEVDVISAYTTDGRIDAHDLVVLDDVRGAIPPYDAVLIARDGLAEDQPAVVAALSALVGSIDAAQMRALNLTVDRDGEPPAAVARRFLDHLD